MFDFLFTSGNSASTESSPLVFTAATIQSGYKKKACHEQGSGLSPADLVRFTWYCLDQLCNTMHAAQYNIKWQ